MTPRAEQTDRPPVRRAGPRSRRRFLGEVVMRGLGTGIALPAMASLRPAAAAAAGGAPPVRMAFLYVPNGVHVDRWRSEGAGRDYVAGPTLEPLAGFRETFQVVSGLAHRSGTRGPDGPGDHARAMATILTGTRPRKTAGADIRSGISVDQVAAARIGGETRFRSLEFACEPVRSSGPCDSGYSCAYSYTMSWSSATRPAAAESSPRLAFERLFGTGTAAERTRSLAARQAGQRSILDFVVEEARSVERRLDEADRRKLDEYLAGIRDVELRITRFDAAAVPAVPDLHVPDGRPTHRDHVRLMADILALAFRTDATRVATLMFAHDGSDRSFPEIGIGDGHHSLSHHLGNAASLEKIAAIDRFHVEQFAYFLGRLQAAGEADGTSLLDHSMIVYASGLSDGNAHRHDDLPVILAGRAGGRLGCGRHVKLPGERPMCDLFVTMLDLVGAPVDRFGDSTGPLPEVLA